MKELLNKENVTFAVCGLLVRLDAGGFYGSRSF